MNNINSQRLDEIGERRIIKEILASRYGQNKADYFGNDCALLSANFSASSAIVATTDPCPEPMASMLGFKDLYYWGWLLGTINLSDIAAAGAEPLGLLTSLILPNETTVEEFTSLLNGIDDCCDYAKTKVVGGNLKEGTKINLSATAIGTCEKSKLLSREGANINDLIVVIGDLGLFWAGVMMIRKEVESGQHRKALLKNILTPKPKVEIGHEIAKKGLLTACMDNSDGLYPSLEQLAVDNNCEMHIDLSSIKYSDEVNFISRQTQIEPIRFALGWGDWQLIGCCLPEKLTEIQDIASKHSEQVFVIGEVREGSKISLHYKGHNGEMTPIDSQRFTQNSWFTAGIESYEKILVEGSLWKN
jgi:thiamine-monophosphate kinase